MLPARLLLMTAVLAGQACSVTLDPTLDPADAGSSETTNSTGGTTSGPEPSPACVAVPGTAANFVVCPAPLSEPAARVDCEAQGGHLAAIRSAADNDALTQAARASAQTTNVWLGGTRDEAHFWSWPDGSVFWHGRFDGAAPDGAFSNFMSGEPNNTASTTEAPEPCLVLVLSSGTWNDRVCELELSYACEL